MSAFAVEQRRDDEREPEPGRTRDGTTTPTAAVAAGPGETIGAAIRAPVEARFGVDLRSARVHRDGRARQAADDLNARAFAHGDDVFLGQNETPTDVGLMAHELVHVAQQRAAGSDSSRAAPVQRKAAGSDAGGAVAAADSGAEKQADQVAGDIAAATIVDASPAAGQQTAAAFMAELEKQVTAAASAELGPLWSAAGCPYIVAFFARHRSSPAVRIEKLAQRYSGVQRPATAQDYIAPIVARVRAGVRTWRSGGDVSADLRVVGMESQAAAAQETGRRSQALEKPDGEIHRKARPGSSGGVPDGAAMSPAEAGEAMDPGSRLEAGALQRMKRAFGRDFSDVRVHTGPDAAGAANAVQARAFTVGNDVTFGSGEYRPGTPQGDALLAHELAHVAQQNAEDGSWSQRAPTAGDPLHEFDADSAATSAMVRLYGPPTVGSVGPLSVQPSRGLRLQRCKKTPSGLAGVADDGDWEGRKVGTHDRPTGRGVAHHDIRAGDTLGFVDSEEAAVALATAGGSSGGAVTIERGKYVAYKAVVLNTNYPGEGHTVEPGVLALIDANGNVKRHGKQGETVTDPVLAEHDPLAGHREAFGHENGKLTSVNDTELLRVFDVALRTNAMNALARSEVEVRASKAHLAGGTATVTKGEIGHIRATINRLQPLAKQKEDAESAKSTKKWSRRIGGIRSARQMDSMGADESLQYARDHIMESEEEKRLAEKIDGLRRQIGEQHAQYPILGRFQSSDDLASLQKITDDNALLARLGSEMPGILESIAATRANVQKGKLDLWQIPSLVNATIGGLGIEDAGQRKVIVDHQKSLAKSSMITDLVLGIFAIGLSIGAIFATGGLALALGAGALGLGVFDAARMTEKYLVEADASNTAANPADSLLDPEQAMHWGWLVVAWAGVALDVLDVASAASKVVGPAVKNVAKGESIEDAARRLAKTMSNDPVEIAELTTKLRNAAGDFPADTLISFSNKAALERRIGTVIEIVETVPEDAVRVMYKIDDLGNVTVTGCRVGRKAPAADIALHAGVVRQLRRYDGVLGRLRQLWDKMRALAGAGGQGAFKPGSEAWESFMELSKHEKILAARKSRLGGGGLTAADEAALKADVDFFENELAHHRKIVEQMSEEAGQGFVASPGNTSRAALKDGMPLPDPANPTGPGLPIPKNDAELDKLVAASPYYYRLQGGKYVLVKKVTATGPSLRWDPVARKFVEGTPTRAEKAAAILASMQRPHQEAFELLGAKLAESGHKLVPLDGVKQLHKTMQEIITSTAGGDFKAKFLAILVEAHTEAGVDAAKAATMAKESMDAFLAHPVTVVQGTDQLRAFGYAANYAKKTGDTVAEGVDLHHLIPLYLGGNHAIPNFAKLPHGPHTKMHELINTLRIDDAVSGGLDVTLSPGKIQALDGFSTGAAILKADGSIEFLSLDEVARRAAAAKAAAPTPTPPLTPKPSP